MDENAHVLAVVAVLSAAGLTVGDGVSPKTDGQMVLPHVVVYPSPGGRVSGNLATMATDASIRFRLVSVGRVATEARFVADAAHAALTAAPVEVSGRSLSRFVRLSGMSSVERDDDLTPPLFYVPTLYGAWSLVAA